MLRDTQKILKYAVVLKVSTDVLAYMSKLYDTSRITKRRSVCVHGVRNARALTFVYEHKQCLAGSLNILNFFLAAKIYFCSSQEIMYCIKKIKSFKKSYTCKVCCKEKSATFKQSIESPPFYCNLKFG